MGQKRSRASNVASTATASIVAICGRSAQTGDVSVRPTASATARMAGVPMARRYTSTALARIKPATAIVKSGKPPTR